MGKVKELKITQVKSVIGYKQKVKLTMKALGFRKIHQTIVQKDTATLRGMLKHVDFIVKVEEN